MVGASCDAFLWIFNFAATIYKITMLNNFSFFVYLYLHLMVGAVINIQVRVLLRSLKKNSLAYFGGYCISKAIFSLKYLTEVKNVKYLAKNSHCLHKYTNIFKPSMGFSWN